MPPWTKTPVVRPPWPKFTSLYVRSSEESMEAEGIALGLRDEELQRFTYVGYELKLTLQVHENGDADLIAVNDTPVNVPNI